MKRLAIAISIIVLSLPLLAEDSPLVRAAKATGRLNKKPRVVITNDTLVTSGGHLATTNATTPFTAGPDSYSNLPVPTRAAGPASPSPAVQPAVATNTVQLTTTTTYQPAASTVSQPPAAQSGKVTMSSTTPVSYSGTAQPATAPVKPPQP